jgi:hypothetical protein
VNYIYHIPANYTNAGRVLGLFEIRNLIEAAALGMPVLFFCVRFLPFELTTKIIFTMILLVPVTGFALIGVSGDCLTRYMTARHRWRKKRRVLTYRGENI